MFYGVVKEHHIPDMCAEVVRVLGGGERAFKLLLGTCATESNFGYYEDTTDFSAGTGLCQYDKKPFYWDLERIVKNKKWVKLCKDSWDINLNQVTWEMLEYNPFLSIIFARLKYKLVPEAIPESLQGIAEYWKKYYNTELGKGTPEKFVTKYNQYCKNYAKMDFLISEVK